MNSFTLSNTEVMALTVSQRKQYINPDTQYRYDPKIVCGDCGKQARYHGHCDENLRWNFSSNSFVIECTREKYSDVGNADRLTFEGQDGHFASLDQANGEDLWAELDNTDTYDAWHVEFDSAMNVEAIEAYRDTNPVIFDVAPNKSIPVSGEFTKATEYHVNGIAHPYKADSWQAIGGTNTPQDQQRNVFVEGIEGFLTVDDPAMSHLTELLHNRMLNVFHDKRTNHLRIGGIDFQPCADGTVNARCVQNSCVSKPLNSGKFLEATSVPFSVRSQMEAFILAVIRHGNNHAASWFTNRQTNFSSKRTIESSIPENNRTFTTSSVLATKTFYKVHTENCNLSCNKQAAHCS